LDLRQLAIQAAGENEDRFEEKELELVFSDNGEAVPVTADPGHTWRIIDNVFSNVLKYSKPGTRVYVSVDNVLRETADGSFVKRGAVTIKNISAKKLGIPVAELMRRFVRGDESRSGEGSGLGLSIAAGLAQIQGGVFYVDIDGDLFKSVLELDSFDNKDGANT
ncbi:MAG: sensor histidine kinase, partial [Clostridia bacterium]|nr:sensor histidine kinase [Clostridia bacterium]